MAITIFTKMSALAKQYNAVNLGQGFPEFDVAPALINLAKKYLSDNKNQYAPLSGAPILLEKIAQKIDKLYSKKVNALEEITITAGATQGIFTAINCILKSNEEAIIFEPAYDSYKPSIEKAGAKAVPIRLLAPNFKIDWNQVENKINKKTKLIIINSPHNPTGQLLSKEDISALAHLVEKHNLYCLSDEVYEHLTFNNHQHNSALEHETLYNKTFCIYSFGKVYNATGWKIGYVVAPPNLTQQFRNLHQWNVFCVNSFLQYALAEYLENEASYLNLANIFEAKKNLLQTAMQETNFEAIPSFGSYFQLYDYGNISKENDIDFSEKLVKEVGLASIPISPFYTNAPNQTLIRLCFAKENETLLKAADLLKKI